MNDFTKEELSDMWCGLGWLLEHEAYHDRNLIVDLREKVKNMHDNYCDHEKTNGCYSCGASQCDTCEKYGDPFNE